MKKEKYTEETHEKPIDIFNKYYKLYKEYRHTCKKCGGIMKLIRQNNAVEHLECPHCKGEILSISDVMSWS